MGQKIHPYSVRLGIIRDWQSQWMSKTRTDLRKNIIEDARVRAFLKKALKDALVEKVLIARNATSITIDVLVGRPGVVIGHKGEGIEKIKKALEDFLKIKKTKKNEKKKVLKINVKGVKNPDTRAAFVAKNITDALEKRIPFRRVVKQALDRLEQFDQIKGIKIQVSGRLDGADMARKEFFNSGSIPLQTLRADIDFARETAYTTYGTVGVKVWIYKGQIFKNKKK
jgi:small subunit ribosomal protein S3